MAPTLRSSLDHNSLKKETGKAMTKTPVNMASVATIFPARVTGYVSPYPTVVAVTKPPPKRGRNGPKGGNFRLSRVLVDANKFVRTSRFVVLPIALFRPVQHAAKQCGTKQEDTQEYLQKHDRFKQDFGERTKGGIV